MGYVVVDSKSVETTEGVSVQESNGNWVLENALVRAVFNKNGRLTSFYDKRYERECIEKGKLGNQFMLFEDIPMYWDAWYVMNILLR
jgi:alpha-mannosidase